MKKIFLFTITLLVLSISFLIIQNTFLKKQSPSTNNLSQVELFNSKYSAKLFSFKYPDGLFPLTDSFSDKAEVVFYLDENSAIKAKKCEKAKLDTMEDPCGYGTLVFIIDIYLNPRDKNSDANWIFDSENLKVASSIVDEKGRIWEIVKGLPWTGSKMNISNDYFVNSKDGKEVVVSIAKPYYSKYRVNLEFNKKLLSTFDY